MKPYVESATVLDEKALREVFDKASVAPIRLLRLHNLEGAKRTVTEAHMFAAGRKRMCYGMR